MIPKIRVFAKAGTKAVFGGGYDRDQMFYEIRDIDFYDKDVTVWGCHRKDCGMCDDTYKFEDVEIMMSTGLKDKNGVEIYEGDIYKYQNEYGETMVTLVHDIHHFVYSLDSYETDIKVIGNIYENPDLLEVTE